MTKQLYDEALVDAKKLREVAEDNAKHALIEAVIPRIRDLIEREMMSEDFGSLDDEPNVDPLDLEVETNDTQEALPQNEVPETIPFKLDRKQAGANVSSVVATDVVPSIDATNVEAISMPDEEGKVTLDVDQLDVNDDGVDDNEELIFDDDEDEEYEMNLESFDALSSIKKLTKNPSDKRFNENLKLLNIVVEHLKRLPEKKIQTNDVQQKISNMITRVENMYEYVQEALSVSSNKEVFEERLETNFKDLNKLTERKKTMKQNKRLNEEDVTLKLTNLPDDIDLDSVGVDLITGDDEGDEDSSDDQDLDLSDLDSDGDNGDEDHYDDDDHQMEAEDMDDDTVVEIDEAVLRQEIKRIKRVHEEAGKGPDEFTYAYFGDGHDVGETLDVGEKEIEASHHVDESEVLEADGLDELDETEMNQLQNRRKNDEYGRGVSDGHETPKMENRVRFEKRLQERAKRHAAMIKHQARSARGTKLEALKKSYARVVKQFNESVARSTKMSLNGKSKQQAENAENKLRTKLAETNLYNAKLMYTNKLLQADSLTKRQKAHIIEALDGANSIREAKLVYESLTKTLSSKPSLKESVEGRKVFGSSSRATRPASTTVVTEGYETDRWAQLAGIRGNK